MYLLSKINVSFRGVQQFLFRGLERLERMEARNSKEHQGHHFFGVRAFEWEISEDKYLDVFLNINVNDIEYINKYIYIHKLSTK